MRLLSSWLSLDPRLFQAVTLGTLLSANILWLDLGSSAGQAAVTIACTLATQTVVCRLIGVRWDWRSPLITGLSLSLLLRSHDPTIWAAAGVLGTASKFALRIRGKHIFNPACLAIVVLLATGRVWVSPGQWGSVAWSGLALAGAALLVLQRAARADTALVFLGTYTALLACRCTLLGDPWTIPWHQLQSGSLLIFAFFMITDPRSTPDARPARFLFAAAVAGLAFHLQFNGQMREGLFYALAIVSLTTPLLDRLLPASRFCWSAMRPLVPETAR